MAQFLSDGWTPGSPRGTIGLLPRSNAPGNSQDSVSRLEMHDESPQRFQPTIPVLFVFFAALLFIASVLVTQSFQQTEAANGESASATYSHGILHVTIPYHAPHAGAGQLSVDPESRG